ncbi:MAG: tetratricopeptide repeat protein [Bacteroidaceae bacterium]|nr:tetratricopeptide repeat protein [Bacteroidaceae bacterium]
MSVPFENKKIVVSLTFILICCVSFANDNLFKQARALQREGKHQEAITAFKDYLTQPIREKNLSNEQMLLYTEALVQLMNTYQSKGEPEACITTLQEVFKKSPILQKTYLRDYYSVLGYALSRTENMKEAEKIMLKAFTLPLHHATPERYFRDYAYAAAVFYSNPDYQKEVIDWCQEALEQTELCKNTSGKQWVTAMLGSIYKRNGNLNEALNLFQQSKEEAEKRDDDLGILNSLHSLIDLFLYWDVPEYANLYATEAVSVEKRMTKKNPMVSAQTYINKGRSLLQLGDSDSVAYYIEEARKLCRHLPYNSGMVDVDLLHGIYLTWKAGDTSHLGIQELQQVVLQGTDINRAKAYHQLAQTYLRDGKDDIAETMLDSLNTLLNKNDSPIYIHLNYKPILNHYLRTKNHHKVEQYTRMMLQEQQAVKERRLHYNLIEAIVESQTEQQRDEIKLAQLEQANQRLMFLICIVLSLIIISVVVAILLYQRKMHKNHIRKSDNKLATLSQELKQTNAEKEMMSQKFDEIMDDMDSRQELETLTPSVLQKKGESKFRQRFELLYPLFLPRLRERVPTITRREELLSMLIVLKQDNKEIAELLAIAPRSVLMLRHRFRQKIGMTADFVLEDFIEEILRY